MYPYSKCRHNSHTNGICHTFLLDLNDEMAFCFLFGHNSSGGQNRGNILHVTNLHIFWEKLKELYLNFKNVKNAFALKFLSTGFVTSAIRSRTTNRMWENKFSNAFCITRSWNSSVNFTDTHSTCHILMWSFSNVARIIRNI